MDVAVLVWERTERELEEEGALQPPPAAGASVPFTYEATEASDAPLPPPPPPLPPYVLSFELPPSWSGALPSTAREGAVISRTAAFVRTSGRQSGQTEIILRVRQQNNPCFYFLEPGHFLHPFYCLLRDVDPEAQQLRSRAALQALGEAYADDEEKAGAAEVPAAPEPEVAPPPEEAPVQEEPPGAQEAQPAPSHAPAELTADEAAVIEKTVGFVLKNGAEYEETIRKAQPAGSSMFAFLHPWSPHNAHYRRRLAQKREEAEAEERAAARRGRGRRWDVAPPAMAPPPQPEPASPPKREPSPPPLDPEEEARRQERLLRARTFGAQRAAATAANATAAHSARLNSHRAALLAFAEEEDVGVLLPEEAPVAAAAPPPSTAGLFRRPKAVTAAAAPSIDQARAAMLASAARLRGSGGADN